MAEAFGSEFSAANENTPEHEEFAALETAFDTAFDTALAATESYVYDGDAPDYERARNFFLRTEAIWNNLHKIDSKLGSNVEAAQERLDTLRARIETLRPATS